MLEPDRKVPNDILLDICSSLLSRDDLTKVALVSHRFNVIAERVLYSSIDITERVVEDNNLPKRTLGWCDAMKRNQLYDVPRKLSIQWRIYNTSNENLSHLCSLLNDNIRRLTRLDTLKLAMHHARKPAVPALELVIRGLCLPNLQHCLLDASDLDYRSSYYEKCTPNPSVLCAFMASLSGLRYLALLQVLESTMGFVPHDAAPELSVFYGTASGAALILPGRPVHHLVLRGRPDFTSKNLSRMALTSVPLRILDLSHSRFPTSVLSDIATHLPTIEILRVNLSVDREYGIEELPPLSSRLASFKKLNWFDLSPTKIREIAMDDQESLCHKWHNVCPSLRYILFPLAVIYMWEWNEAEREWLLYEPPTQESADGLYDPRYFDI